MVIVVLEFILFLGGLVLILFCMNRMCHEELDDDFDTI